MTDEVGVSVVPGIVAARLEDLGLVEVLASAPDFSLHQRVRWLWDGFDVVQARMDHLRDLADSVDS